MKVRLNVLTVEVTSTSTASERLHSLELAMNDVLARYKRDYWRAGHRSKFTYKKGNLVTDSYIDLNLYNNSTGSWEHYSILLKVCESEDASHDS